MCVSDGAKPFVDFLQLTTAYIIKAPSTGVNFISIPWQIANGLGDGALSVADGRGSCYVVLNKRGFRYGNLEECSVFMLASELQRQFTAMRSIKLEKYSHR